MDPSIESTAVKKAFRRLVWFLALLMFCAVMDRVNVGFAALSMNRDLGLNAAAFGMGAGLFSLAYLLFEIPSNLILRRVGARRWIARIMVTWSLLSMATALATGTASFYAVRFALGAAEAGLLPGVMFYLGTWFPGPYRARTNAVFLLSMPLGQAFAAFISGFILQMDGLLGLAGWQWLFVLEGMPTLVFGVATWFYLTDRPADARWLTELERDAIDAALAREAKVLRKLDSRRLVHLFFNGRVWLLGLAYLAIDLVLTGVPLWMPQVVRTLGLSYGVVGVVTALPPLVGVVAMILWGRSSDKRKERAWHIFAACGVCGLGWLLAANNIHDPVILIGGLVLANAGILAATVVFWAMPSEALSGLAAAAGIGMISAFGNIGATLGPVIVGRLRDNTAGFSAPFLFFCAAAVVGGGLIVLSRKRAAIGVPRPAEF
jgi:ACS family tartrate transporter-like MFS transporter